MLIVIYVKDASTFGLDGRRPLGSLENRMVTPVQSGL